MFLVYVLFLVVSTSAIDCLERLISEMTYYVSSGKLNPTHSLTHLSFVNLVSFRMHSAVIGSFLGLW